MQEVGGRMCEFHRSDANVLRRGRHAAVSLLGRPATVRKAFDLSTGRGFDQAASELADRLGDATAALDAAVVRQAVQGLDIDWKATTAAGRRRLLSEAASRAGVASARVVGPLQQTLGPAALEVVEAARADVRRQGLRIGADFNAVDGRIVRYLQTSETGFVTDEYGRRARAFSRRARAIVASGLAEGLGNADISEALRREATGVLGGRSGAYWEMVAASFVGRGRSFGQLSGYAEAGVDQYRIEAVLDEATTEVCRFLHGKVFSVRRGLDLFQRAENRPESIKSVAPWVRVASDPRSERTMLVAGSGDSRTPIAEVIRSGVGTRDDLGEFRRPPGGRELADLGLGPPPFHGLCRSTCLAVL